MNVFNDERDWPPMAQMRQISQIVVNYHLSVSIGIVCVISGQFFMFIFVVSENSITFVLNSVATAVV